MPGKFLIDVTDPRFQIAGNEDVLDFIRRVNPFAHSDVGSLLLELGKGIPGSEPYCPSYRECAYVVLHTDSRQIFAIAFGQRALAVRLASSSRTAALADGAAPAPDIGPDWVVFDAWDASASREIVRSRLQRWCAQACADAAAIMSPNDH